jgi:hypothetical protein
LRIVLEEVKLSKNRDYASLIYCISTDLLTSNSSFIAVAPHLLWTGVCEVAQTAAAYEFQVIVP